MGAYDIRRTMDEKSMTMAIAAVSVLVMMMLVYYAARRGGDGFVSPDGVVARRSQKQKRDDPGVDREWNLAELEKSVALINRAAGP